MTSLELAQSLIKSDDKFTNLAQPVLSYISSRSGSLRAYSRLILNENNEVVSFFCDEPLAKILDEMKSSDEYKDIEIMSAGVFDAKERESLEKQYKVGKPTQVSKSRYWDMLETLPPCEWVRGSGVESFRFAECLASDLFMYFFRVGNHYFEMVNHIGSDLTTMIEACKNVEVVEIPDEEEV